MSETKINIVKTFIIFFTILAFAAFALMFLLGMAIDWRIGN